MDVEITNITHSKRQMDQDRFDKNIQEYPDVLNEEQEEAED